MEEKTFQVTFSLPLSSKLRKLPYSRLLRECCDKVLTGEVKRTDFNSSLSSLLTFESAAFFSLRSPIFAFNLSSLVKGLERKTKQTH